MLDRYAGRNNRAGAFFRPGRHEPALPHPDFRERVGSVVGEEHPPGVIRRHSAMLARRHVLIVIDEIGPSISLVGKLCGVTQQSDDARG